MCHFGMLVSGLGMVMSFLRMLFCGRVIAFPVMLSGYPMAFCSVLVMFSSHNVGLFWHFHFPFEAYPHSYNGGTATSVPFRTMANFKNRAMHD